MYRKKVQVEGTRSMTGEPVVFIGSERKGQDAARDSFKGKQFATVRSGRAFGKIEYEPHPYDDASAALKDSPLDGRKLGFYSRSPIVGPSTFHETERFREHIRIESKHSATAGAISTPPKELPASASVTSSPTREALLASRPTSTYDCVFDDPLVTRLDWQKTSRDRFYHDKLRPAWDRKVMGSMAVASDAYGEGAWAVTAPEHAKRSASKRFSDIGHREANGSSF